MLTSEVNAAVEFFWQCQKLAADVKLRPQHGTGPWSSRCRHGLVLAAEVRRLQKLVEALAGAEPKYDHD